MDDRERPQRPWRVLAVTVLLIGGLIALCGFSFFAIDYTVQPTADRPGGGLLPALFVALTGIGIPTFGVVGSEPAAWMARLSLVAVILCSVSLSRSAGPWGGRTSPRDES
jgi:hypothetical protein